MTQRPILAHLVYDPPIRNWALHAALTTGTGLILMAAAAWLPDTGKAAVLLCMAIACAMCVGNTTYTWLRSSTTIGRHLRREQFVWCAGEADLEDAKKELTKGRSTNPVHVAFENGDRP